MEKDWSVECWGDWGNFTTELFYAEREARSYFREIRKTLDTTKYTFSKDSIVSLEDPERSVNITNLREL